MKKLIQALDVNKKLLIPYLTPDFPFKGTTELLIPELERIGVKVMELGIPFSDPLADGPTIQASSLTALKNGANLSRVLELAGWISKNSSISVILMGYINPIMQYGFERFFKEAASAGVQGVIIPDVPQDEANMIRTLAMEFQIAPIFLVAPVSKTERIKLISEMSPLFSYCVSMNGVTGSAELQDDVLKQTITSVSQYHEKPLVVGFGLNRADQIKTVCSLAKGAVVGSAFIKALDKGTSAELAVKEGIQFLQPLVEATNE